MASHTSVHSLADRAHMDIGILIKNEQRNASLETENFHMMPKRRNVR